MSIHSAMSLPSIARARFTLSMSSGWLHMKSK
jgi:hypothetical protein